MENRAYTVGAGVFVLSLVVLLLAAILWFNERGHLRGAPYDLLSDSSVAGLTVGAMVDLRGVEVGQVQGIGFDTTDPSKVRVRIAVDRKIRLFKGSYATLKNNGLSGNAYVELDFADKERETLATSPEMPATIPLRPSAWAALPDTGEQFLTTFDGTLERANAFLTPENAQHLSRLLVEFSAAAEQMNGIARDLRPVARRAGSVVEEADQTLSATHRMLGDLDKLITETETHLGALDAVGEGAHQTGLAVQGLQRAVVLDTLPKLDQLAQGLSQNSDTLEELLEELKERPQSVIFGARPPPPGPGEPGFSSREEPQ